MEEILNTIFNESWNLFLENETDNVLNNVSERNLCSRLAIYLNDKVSENELIGYFVDPEYNRKQNGQIKTIIDNEENEIGITCDLIIHSRGVNIQHDNLMAVEMKKSNRTRAEKESDKIRLRALTKDSYDGIWANDGVTHPKHVCGYILGFYLELNLQRREWLIEKYQRGERVDERRQTF